MHIDFHRSFSLSVADKHANLARRANEARHLAYLIMLQLDTKPCNIQPGIGTGTGIGFGTGVVG